MDLDDWLYILVPGRVRTWWGVILMGALLAVLIGLLIWGVTSLNQEKQECQDKGGRPVEKRNGGIVCVKETVR